MSNTLKIKAKSSKGTEFTIEFEVLEQGRLKLPNSPKKARNWKFRNSSLYKKNKDLKALIFIMSFLKDNKIKLTQLSAIDLAEIITLLLELPRIPKPRYNGLVRYEHSEKARAYAHSLMDLYLMMIGV